MPLFRPVELLGFLEEIGASPKKSLSQNFLIDGNILDKIVALADVQPGDLILEIGSGPGALTEKLLAKGAHVLAVEKDDKLADHLLRFEGIEVFKGDIRDFPLERLKGERRYKVVANLPYHLTTPILFLLMNRSDLFSSITVMVQEEVGRKMTAKPGQENYRLLSVLLAFYSDCQYGFKVSRRCFLPSPNVDSAVVKLTLKEPPLESPAEFFRLLKMAFSRRRKMLKSTLKELYSAADLQQLPHLEARPEHLSLQDFVAVYQKLHA